MSSENFIKFWKTIKTERDFITFLIWSIVTIFYTIVDPTWIYAPANTPLIVIFTTKSRGITFYCKLVMQNILSYMNRLLISNSKIGNLNIYQGLVPTFFRFRDPRILSDAKTKYFLRFVIGLWRTSVKKEKSRPYKPFLPKKWFGRSR